MDTIENANKYAAILLKHYTFHNYFESKLKDTTMDFLKIRDLFDELSEMKIESHTIASEWGDNAAEFRADGYTLDDVLYDDWTEALVDNKDTILEAIALVIIEAHFEKDMYFLNPMVAYVEKKLNESGKFI